MKRIKSNTLEVKEMSIQEMKNTEGGSIGSWILNQIGEYVLEIINEAIADEIDL